MDRSAAYLVCVEADFQAQEGTVERKHGYERFQGSRGAFRSCPVLVVTEMPRSLAGDVSRLKSGRRHVQHWSMAGTKLRNGWLDRFAEDSCLCDVERDSLDVGNMYARHKFEMYLHIQKEYSQR